ATAKKPRKRRYNGTPEKRQKNQESEDTKVRQKNDNNIKSKPPTNSKH
ncbi:15040_t:CDS:1, partial [Gigaspora rosea]